LIRIEVDDVDPDRAAALANEFVAELNAQNRRLAVSDASQRRLLLEDQLEREKAALSSAEDAMKRGQQTSGMIEVNGQTQVAIASIAQVSAQIKASEVALQRLKLGATVENPAVRQTEAELAELHSQLHRLETSARDGPLLATSAIPDVGLGYVRRLRDVKYHEFLYEMLSKEYEAARIDESKAASPLQVVDIAVPPDQKSGPHRVLISALGGVIGVTVGTFLACLLHYRKSVPGSRAAQGPISRA
jgi:uncharacterized protein involved in exopolysaccharide biosynthesis